MDLPFLIVFLIASVAMPIVWPLGSLAASMLTGLIVGLARARFQPKEIVVDSERLTIRTYDGYSRVVALERLHWIRSVGGHVELTFSQNESVWFSLKKREYKAVVDFLVTELDLVPTGRGRFEKRSYAQAKAAHSRPGGQLVCPRCERERPSEYWFQAPDGTPTDICIECSAQATTQPALES